jgi:uncharacterized protein (TIGR02285 family)
MPWIVRAAAAAVAACTWLPLQAETMTWLLRDFPPSSMPVDGRPTQGLADEFVKAIVKRWPEVEHRYLVANNKRIVTMLEHGEPACFTTALRVPERERSAYIADMLLVPPQMLVTRHELLARLPLNARGEVRFAELLADGSLHGSLLQSRSYGSYLDRLIRERPRDSGASLSAASVRPLQQVAHRRADYAIDYDYTLAWEQQADAKATDEAELVSVPIEGNEQTLVAGIACPRTEWGRRMIVQIDRHISALAQDAQARSGVERWMTPNARQRYGRLIEDFYKRRAQPTPESAFAPAAATPAASPAPR